MDIIRSKMNRFNNEVKVALYGLSTETERFISEYGDKLTIVGLLDGYRTDGEMYGYPIIPIEKTVSEGVRLIIVIARPGSCKAISQRIGEFCRSNDIALFDVRGKDLLKTQTVSYSYKDLEKYSKRELSGMIEKTDIISFDLFDTLIARKVYNYTDIFSLLSQRLLKKGIDIPGFAALRLSAEKECSRDHSPVLSEIYQYVLERSDCNTVTADELVKAEWDLDVSLMIPRTSVCNIYRDLVAQGKRVIITTDNYYTGDMIESLLESYELGGYENIFVSCEHNTAKTQSLFEKLCDLNNGNPERILHIGDDEYADIECARRYGIKTFRVYSGVTMLDSLGGLGLEEHMSTIADRVRVGLFISRIFNDPFVFESEDLRLSAADASDIGYLFCAPMITDFTLWMLGRIEQDSISQVLLCARDGYLIKKLFDMMGRKSFYFLTSRTAAIRAGMRTEHDLEYVDSMKYFGSDEESLKVRFGISVDDIDDKASRSSKILERSKKLRENYKKYMDKLGIEDVPSAMFDLVAKGTTQMYLAGLFGEHIKGYYFLQLEPEFMADKGLDIEPFYSEEEKDRSAIFDNYYILETILTSPDPQTAEFDDNGEPVFSKETRCERDIGCFMRAQSGVVEYFKDFINILKDDEIDRNKKLDEQFLAMINHVKITDEDFLSLTIEDPFFGRMTAMKSVIG